MTPTNGNDTTKAGIRSLGELAQNIPPPRDLWPAIAAEISQDMQRAGAASSRGARVDLHACSGPRLRRSWPLSR